jgi:hypothetical protein
MRAVPVARKLSTIEEWCQDQSCLFRRDYRNKDHDIEKLSWVQVLTRMVSVARKLSTIQERLQSTFVRFCEEITGTNVTNSKTVLGSCPGEDVGLGIIFFYDIQRYVSNDQACGKLSDNKS